MIRDTSIEAYRIIEATGLLSKARWEIYKILFHHGPLTRSEIDKHLAFGCYKSHVSARLCELRDMGVIQEIGKRECQVTHMEVILWDVNSKLPVELPKTKPKIQIAIEQERQACAAIAFQTQDIIGQSIGNKILERGAVNRAG